jgi:hypothetical protein
MNKQEAEFQILKNVFINGSFHLKPDNSNFSELYLMAQEMSEILDIVPLDTGEYSIVLKF